MEPHVITLPKWVFVLRILQVVLALAVLGLSAYGIYWVPYSAWCFALYQSLATFIIVAYNLLTTHITSCKPAYNYWAVLGLDIYAIIFWLASMAGLAARRAAFRIPTTITSCYNDGYGGFCVRDLSKRDVATYGYLNMLSISAVISAIEMLMFIAILVVFSIRLRRHRAAKSHTAPVITNDKLEAQSVPMNPVQFPQQQQQYPPQQHQQQQYAPQHPQQYAAMQQGVSPQETHYTPTPPPQHTYSPPPQQQYSMPAQPYHQAPEVAAPPTQHIQPYHQAPEVAPLHSPNTTGH